MELVVSKPAGTKLCVWGGGDSVLSTKYTHTHILTAHFLDRSSLLGMYFPPQREFDDLTQKDEAAAQVIHPCVEVPDVF